MYDNKNDSRENKKEVHILIIIRFKMDENLIQRNQNFSTIISWLHNNHCSANQSKKNDSNFNP